MRQIILRKRAQLGLEQIVESTEQEWGNKQAVALVHFFRQSFLMIAEFPYIGRPYHGEDAMVYVMSKVPFVIIYQVKVDSVRIVKILHTKRNR